MKKNELHIENQKRKKHWIWSYWGLIFKGLQPIFWGGSFFIWDPKGSDSESRTQNQLIIQPLSYWIFLSGLMSQNWWFSGNKKTHISLSFPGYINFRKLIFGKPPLYTKTNGSTFSEDRPAMVHKQTHLTWNMEKPTDKKSTFLQPSGSGEGVFFSIHEGSEVKIYQPQTMHFSKGKSPWQIHHNLYCLIPPKVPGPMNQWPLVVFWARDFSL